LNQLYGLDEALAYIESTKKDYDDKKINLNLALHQISLLNENKMYEEVIEFCNDFLIQDPLLTNILYARAMAYESLRKIDLMEIDLRKILSVDARNANTLNALGYSLIIHTKRYEEAYSLLLEAYHYDPGNAAILDSIAWAEYKKGNYAKALDYIESSYYRDKDPEIIEHYCEILIKNKQFKKLKKVIKLELERNKNNLEFIDKLKSYHNDPVL
jgi:Flp pilus assembly protein TadD